MERSGACQTRDVPRDPEWTFIAQAPRAEDVKQQALTILAEAGLTDLDDGEIRIDLNCALETGEDSINVWDQERARRRPLLFPGDVDDQSS
jgi:hypothetical protein